MNMGEIHEKERFLGTMLGKKVDRFPYYDLDPAPETLERWRKEGLPEDTTVADFFDLERHRSVGVTLRTYPYYKGAPDILRDPSTFSRYYDLDHEDRFLDGFAERGDHLNKTGRVLYVEASGGGLLQMLGVHDWESMVHAMYALVEKPRQIEQLVDKTTDFYCLCLERVLSRVSVDYASFYEPIASNKGPVISPATFERYAMPGYRKVLAVIDKYDIPLRIFCTTGGNLSSLLPPLIEAGMNALWISNIQSSRMKYSALRKTYGREIALIGGVDSNALGQGLDEVRRAVMETVPELLAGGRYLPCLDDRPRANIPFERYRQFRRLLVEISS
jgi:hypothetical protein